MVGEGILNVKPVIKEVSFAERGKISIYLKDGRTIIAPLSLFPSIKKLSTAQRKKYYIIDDQILMFDDCNEVFHIEQFLGKENVYQYRFAS